MTINELRHIIFKIRYENAPMRHRMIVVFFTTHIHFESWCPRKNVSDIVEDYHQIMQLISLLPRHTGYSITERFEDRDSKYCVHVQLEVQNDN